MVPACPFRQPYMIFLFVGSSGLTEASFPRDLAIPQLLLSSACVILLRVKANRILVFPHRGLAPHQFTPMSGADQPVQRTGMSRSGQRQLQRQGRLIPVAYL